MEITTNNSLHAPGLVVVVRRPEQQDTLAMGDPLFSSRLLHNAQLTDTTSAAAMNAWRSRYLLNNIAVAQSPEATTPTPTSPIPIAHKLNTLA